MEGMISFYAAYGGIALFISLLNNIFLLYYVDTFVNVYKIDSTSFWIGEVGTYTCYFASTGKASRLTLRLSIYTNNVSIYKWPHLVSIRIMMFANTSFSSGAYSSWYLL